MSESSGIHVSGLTRTFSTTFHKLAESINSPRSLMLSMLLASGEQDDLIQLVSSTCDPLHYREGDEQLFAEDYLIAKIASKLPSEFRSWNILEPTLKQFCEQEDHCAIINRQCVSGEILDRLEAVGVRIGDLRKLMKRVLGRAPSLAACCQAGGWGPGSTVLHNREESVPEAKCTDTSVTYRLAKALQDAGCHGDLPWWSAPWVLVPGNLMFTVDKNAKSLRTASAEPAINGWVQKGIGSFIRRALRKIGIDLNDQSINQMIALGAMRFGYATIDVRGASNSQALELFRLCLPKDWMDLLDISRSERGTFEERTDLSSDSFWFEYEMISSMGNGFTFELESLLFYCIARMADCNSDEVWIYGDDIIVPQACAQKVVDILEVCGFSVNTEKSFLDGLFFESCGVHVFNGCDVTPFFIKDALNEPKDVLRTANELRLFGTRMSSVGFSCRHLLPVYRYLVGRLPDSFKTRGPAGGGLCLFSNIEEFDRKQFVSGRLEYNHLIPSFRYTIQPQWTWSFEQFLASHQDHVRGPVPRVPPSCFSKKDARVLVTRHSLKNELRRAIKRGEGETPFLLQYRLFTLTNPHQGEHEWVSVLDSPNQGNGVARVSYRKWSNQELSQTTNHDRSRYGTLAHKIVRGVCTPQSVPTLTNWST